MLLLRKDVFYRDVGHVFVIHVYPPVATLRLATHHGCVVTLVKLFTVMKYNCAYVCRHVCMYLCRHVCMYLCMCVYDAPWLCSDPGEAVYHDEITNARTYAGMYVSMHACMHVCVFAMHHGCVVTLVKLFTTMK